MSPSLNVVDFGSRLLRRVGMEKPARYLWRSLLRSLGFQTGKQYQSETSRCRKRLAPYCQGNGLDLGFGGDPITKSAIRMDLPQPYADTGDSPVQLGGTAENLWWFKDHSLDYIYSSHLLEDYPDTKSVLIEWLRVLKPGGLLILYCPHEQIYRRHCEKTGQPYNTNHVHENFSLSFVKQILELIGQTQIVHENDSVEIYSWELVCEKIPL